MCFLGGNRTQSQEQRLIWSSSPLKPDNPWTNVQEKSGKLREGSSEGAIVENRGRFGGVLKLSAPWFLHRADVIMAPRGPASCSSSIFSS